MELGSTWNTKRGKRRKREGKMFFFFIYDDGDVERERKGLSSLVKKALFPRVRGSAGIRGEWATP